MLCYDPYFKSLFIGRENILARMVSDITGIDYSILKDNVLLEINELPINWKYEKVKKCDFILRISDDRIINLELNQQSYAGMIVKNFSYLFHLFSSSSIKYEKYNDDLIVTQINLNCYKENNNDNPLKKYSLREDDTNKLYVKNVIIYDLNIVKCHEIYYNELKKEKLPNYIKWGALIFNENIEEMPDILASFLSNEEMNCIMAGIDKLTHEDLLYTEQEALAWAEWERRSIEEDIRKKATKEGHEEGFKQGIEKNTKETIKNMINKKISIDDISEITGKSIEEIEQIIKE